MKRRKRYVIAIDGPAGSGKSTVAKLLARRLGYVNIDSGAIYRALTLAALEEGVDPADEKKAVAAAKKTSARLGAGAGRRMQVFLKGRNVTSRLRSAKVSDTVAAMARFRGVRVVARKLQRQAAGRGGVVMEGRDIGTAVFPGAELKFYLSASLDERARRRYLELKGKGERLSYAAVKRAIAGRDRKDRSRAESPLRAAKDAVRIDSTGLKPSEVVARMAGIVEEYG